MADLAKSDFLPGEIVILKNSVISGLQDYGGRVELELIRDKGFWEARFLHEEDRELLISRGVIGGSSPTIHVSPGALEHEEAFMGSVEDVFDELLE